MPFYINSSSQWGGRKSIALHTGTVFKYFPALKTYASWKNFNIDLDVLIRDVQIHFRGYRSRSVGKILKSFFGRLTVNIYDSAQLRQLVINHVSQFFDIDTQPRGSRSYGLPIARANFAVLAHLAEISNSQHLARYLIDVFWMRGRDIIAYEQDGSLPTWFAAFSCLRSVSPRDEIDNCIAYLLRRGNSIRNTYYNMGRYDPQIEQLIRKMDRMMEQMNRGRSFHQPLILPRARTLPPPVRTAVPMLMPAPGWTSAYASPALTPYDDYLRDAEIDEVKDRLEQVEINQQI